LLPVFQDVRGLLDDLGLRTIALSLRVTTWSGERVGLGTPTVSQIPLTLDTLGHRIKVRRLSSRDVIASGGRYQAGDFRVGPFTPAFAGGGRDPSYFDPPVSDLPQEVVFLLVGPGFPDAGMTAKKVEQETDRSFSYYLILRATSTQ
jgi:hypothetical protein